MRVRVRVGWGAQGWGEWLDMREGVAMFVLMAMAVFVAVVVVTVIMTVVVRGGERAGGSGGAVTVSMRVRMATLCKFNTVYAGNRRKALTWW